MSAASILARISGSVTRLILASRFDEIVAMAIPQGSGRPHPGCPDGWLPVNRQMIDRCSLQWPASARTPRLSVRNGLSAVGPRT